MPQGKEGPGCTPTVDGELLYVLGLGGDLACLQVKDGKIVWQRSLTRDFGGRVPMWSYRESPLVDGDKVICTPGGQDATLVALDKLTGKTIWKSQVPGGSGGGPGGPVGPVVAAVFPAVAAVAAAVPAVSAVRRFWSGLRLGHRHRLRRAAPVRAAHREGARRGRGVRRQVPLAV